MNKIMRKDTVIILFLLALSAYLFFFHLGKFALTDPDETFYAETAKEMFTKGEWATPLLYGKPQFEKPIMLYWLVEASYALFGVNEFAARLPSAIFAVFGIIAMYLLGCNLFSKRVGLLAAIMLASSVEYVILARACITDMVLSTFMLLVVLFFFYGHTRGKWYFYLLSAASLALATLTKGPIAIMLAGAAILIYLVLVKDTASLRRVPWVWSAMTFLLIAAPWYVVAYKLHGSALLNEFFGFHNVTRFLQAEHKIGSQFYYNIPIALGGFFPWSVFLPVGLWRMWKKVFSKDPKEARPSIFTLVWFAVIFIFFSASSTKLPTYIFPCFISLALVAAVFWDDFLKDASSGKKSRGMEFSYYLLILIMVIGSIAAMIYLKFGSRYSVILSGVSVSILCLLSVMAISFAAFIRKRYEASLWLIVLAFAIFLYPMNELALPHIERYEASKEISQELLKLVKPGQKLGSQSNYLAGIAFYAGKFAQNIDAHEDLVRYINSDERTWVVVTEKNHRDLYNTSINSQPMKASYLVYKIGKKCIVTNQIPEDGKYILKREGAG